MKINTVKEFQNTIYLNTSFLNVPKANSLLGKSIIKLCWGTLISQ